MEMEMEMKMEMELETGNGKLNRHWSSRTFPIAHAQ